MTTSLKILILAALMLIGPAYGQAKFLGICENSQSPLRHEMKWLKMFFKVESCQEVAAKISKLQSYNEFFLHFSISGPDQERSWINAFPHFYGLRTSKSKEQVPWHRLGPDFNFGSFFKDPEIYSEFKNLKIIDLSVDSKKTPCELLKSLPHIEIALVDRMSLVSLNECKPLENLPDLIVLRDFLNIDAFAGLRDKIIGIEHMVTFTRELYQFPRLRYLGISYPFNDIYQYQTLIQNQNITHLSFNSTNSLAHAFVLGELPNLSYLAITCITSHKTYHVPGMAGDLPEYCPNAELKNVNFLKSLTFLEEIVLDFEGLEDISALEQMPQLKTVTHPFVP